MYHLVLTPIQSCGIVIPLAQEFSMFRPLQYSFRVLVSCALAK
nr:MAG TPA: hypothetical protein [Caudoviricetes sp.]